MVDLIQRSLTTAYATWTATRSGSAPSGRGRSGPRGMPNLPPPRKTSGLRNTRGRRVNRFTANVDHQLTPRIARGSGTAAHGGTSRMVLSQRNTFDSFPASTGRERRRNWVATGVVVLMGAPPDERIAHRTQFLQPPEPRWGQRAQVARPQPRSRAVVRGALTRPEELPR